MAPRCARRRPRLAGCEAGLQPNDNRDRKQNHVRTINPTQTLLLPASPPYILARAARKRGIGRSSASQAIVRWLRVNTDITDQIEAF